MDNLTGAGFNNVGPAVQTTGNTQSSTAYSLAAKVAVAREDTFVAPNLTKPTPQIDLAALARAAMDEELRRKGGGGGGGGYISKNSYNPMLWIPYSFKLMAQAMDQSRALLAQSLNQALAFIPNLLNRLATNVNNAFVNFARSLTSPIANLMTQMQRQAATVLEAIIKSPVNFAVALGSNVSHLANTIANALTQGLKKLVYGKDEKDEEFFEKRKDNANIFDTFKNWLKNFKSDSN